MGKKSITFLSPSKIDSPTGGMKMILEHANRLAFDGYNVIIECPCVYSLKGKTLKEILRVIYHYLRVGFSKKFSCNKWFQLDKKIQLRWIFSLDYCFIKKSDIYIATAVQTAPILNTYPIKSNKKFYFIQDYENWSVTDDYVRNTYHFPMKKLVITKWLSDIIRKEEKEHCILAPNGFNFDEYKITIPIENKDCFTISMLYHIDERKGIPTAFKALEIVKQEIPEIQVLIFGSTPSPELPSWYHYYYRPNAREHLEINNKAAIYIGASYIEGFGLTIGEAMLCGQAVACTDNLGYQEMAKNEKTALVSPIRDYKALASNIIRLIKEKELRIQIAKNGYNYIRSNYSWEISHEQFLKALELK